MRLDVRPAIYPDIPKLARIKQLARGLGDDPNSAAFGAELQYLTEFLDDRQSVFVQLIDRVPVAYCAVRERSAKPFAGYAYIKDLYVLPEWQDRGCGKKLLMHALRTMRGKGYMNAVLETAENYAGARRFYERFGFELRDIGGSDGFVTYTIDF